MTPATLERVLAFDPFLTPLIGRDQQVEELLAMLRRPEVRVVTVTGPGGVGKTRLALTAAERLMPEFEHRIWLVPLASVQDSSLVPAAVARTLGVNDQGGRAALDACVDALADVPALLLIDNAEHVMDGVAALTELVARCPRTTLLVSSREPLRVRGERQFPLTPLALPEDPRRAEESPAVALFVERAAAVKPGFQLTDDNRDAVVEICVRLDGLPLAIELAAARVKVLAPAALLNRLSNTFQVLAGGPRDMPARQQTMRGAIAWSYDLLTGAERDLLQLISVFAGVAPFEAIAAIWAPWTGDDDPMPLLDGLDSLVSKNLVTSQDVDGEMRYEMLETIRAFGRDALETSGRSGQLHRMWADWYAGLARDARGKLVGPSRSAVMARLRTHDENLRAALRWAIETGDRGLALTFVAGLWRFWDACGTLMEGASEAGRALALPGAVDDELLAEALYGAAVMPFRMGDYSEARRLCESCLEVSLRLDDPSAVAQAWNGLGLVGYDTGEFNAAEQAFVETLALRRRIGESYGITVALLNLGIVLIAQTRYDEAEAAYREVLEINPGDGKKFERAYALNGLGIIARLRGDLPRAIAIHTEAVEVRRASGDTGMLAMSLANLGATVADAGDPARGAELLRESLQHRWTRGERRGTAESLTMLATVASRSGDARLAVALLAAARSITVPGISLPTAVREEGERVTSELRAALGRAEFARLETAALAAPLADTVARALTLAPVAASPSPQVAAGHETPLTPRELEVLRLIAAGKSDREIGDTLFISRATAARHAANIFGKIDVNSRTAAAAWAFRNGVAGERVE